MRYGTTSLLPWREDLLLKNTVFANPPRTERNQKLAQALLQPLEHPLNLQGLLLRALLNMLNLLVGKLGAQQVGVVAGRPGPIGGLGRLPMVPCFVQGCFWSSHFLCDSLDLDNNLLLRLESWVLVGLRTSRMEGCSMWRFLGNHVRCHVKVVLNYMLAIPLMETTRFHWHSRKVLWLSILI